MYHTGIFYCLLQIDTQIKLHIHYYTDKKFKIVSFKIKFIQEIFLYLSILF